MLFDLPDEPDPKPTPSEPGPPLVGTPRFPPAVPDPVCFHAASLDELIPQDHPARVIWDYTLKADLSSLYQQIKAVERHAGRPPIDPRILVALWLHATTRGVGGARLLDELRRDKIDHQWIRGDVSVNSHTLADCRRDHGDLLDGLPTQSVAVMMAEGLVDRERVAQDGMRVRVRADAASFRREPTLEEALAEAQTRVETPRQEREDDPKASRERQKQARRRAAEDRAARIAAALRRLPELEARKTPDEKDKARCSTTDADATVMKMANGGFNPADNVQFATDTRGQMIVGVDVVTTGSDQGRMPPMVGQIQERYGKAPGEYEVDGGFAKREDIQAVSAPGVGRAVYAPARKPKDPKVDRHAPHPGASVAVAEWRRRMGTPAAREIDKDRAATAEWVNALARRRGLARLVARGLAKVRVVALWIALAHNVRRVAAPRAAAANP